MRPVNENFFRETCLISRRILRIVLLMGVQQNPITLTPEQVEELNKQLSHMRHEINNHLSLIIAAAELIRFKPDMIQKMSGHLTEQPKKITRELAEFSMEFEKILNITRE